MEAREENPAEALSLVGFIELANGHRILAAERFHQALDALDDPDLSLQEGRKWYLWINSIFADALYGMESALD